MTTRPPRITLDDVGSFYIDEAGEVWRLVGYAADPTATLEKVEPRQDARFGEPRPRVNGVVGAPIFAGFRKLVPIEGE